MYEGSMVGAGLDVFGVWNYCIIRNRSGIIELNPKLLAFVLGAKEDVIAGAIEKLCRPDPQSRSQDHEGRRLIKDGQFQYRMVNWATYDALKTAADLREYNRRKQAEHRERERKRKQQAQAVQEMGEGQA